MKINRLLSIIMVLLERDTISASKLAEMFEVTRRTIFRDIEAINLAGIPIVTFPGIHGGIGIMKQYKIEKRLFTVSDITTLLTGIQSLHSSLSDEDIANTLAKVKGLVPEERMKEIELTSSQVMVDHTPWSGNKTLLSHLANIKTALREHKLLIFQYNNPTGETTKRTIETYRLILKQSNWYVQGYCLYRRDFRTFKLTRMSELEISSDTFQPRPFDAAPLTSPKTEQVFITLKIDDSLKNIMKELGAEDIVAEQETGKWIVRFPFTEDDFGYGLLLRFGTHCECLEPERVRIEMRLRIEALRDLYGQL